MGMLLPVQKAGIPAVMAGRNTLIIAQATSSLLFLTDLIKLLYCHWMIKS